MDFRIGVTTLAPSVCIVSWQARSHYSKGEAGEAIALQQGGSGRGDRTTDVVLQNRDAAVNFSEALDRLICSLRHARDFPQLNVAF